MSAARHAQDALGDHVALPHVPGLEEHALPLPPERGLLDQPSRLRPLAATSMERRAVLTCTDVPLMW
jgi:hypothetical protein